ncbi:MAG: DsbA family protein [Gemmatimonadaceae bacterium]|nr:DsbA family protein [Gemmatimonadaceae bacterium]
MKSIRLYSCAAVFAALSSAACTPTSGKPAAEAKAGTPQAAAATATPSLTDSLVARADRGRIEGSADAKVWLVIVSDFQCPYCKQSHDSTFEQIRKEYVRTGKIKVAYVNFPLNSHQNAWPSAHGAMCASEQGKFWPYADALFKTQEKWAVLQAPKPFFDSLAVSFGLDMKQWRDCVTSERMAGLIRSDRDRGVEAGVNSTPSYLVGDKGLAGVHPMEDFRKLLDPAIAAAAATGH